MTSEKSLSSTVKLNDGVSMPIFGLGTYVLKPGVGGEAELAVKHALKVGYKMIDTAEFFGWVCKKVYFNEVKISIANIKN